MSTNRQAQQKAAVNAAPAPTVREASSAGPTMVSHGVKQIKSSPSLAPQKSMDFLESEPRIVTLPANIRANRLTQIRYAASKRAFDLILGMVLLVIAAPIIAIAAAAIRINSPGSPFFFQTRLGKNGRPFKIFKLRGMFIDARERFPNYYDYSAKRDLEFCFHHKEDPRVTGAGRFLRRTSIDELPNLWNVMMGDMSLVGPRPEIPEVLSLYGPYRDEYLSVKPGVTCLSKCTGRDRLTKLETVNFDLGYVRNASFGLDLKILWKTLLQVLLIRDVF